MLVGETEPASQGEGLIDPKKGGGAPMLTTSKSKMMGEHWGLDPWRSLTSGDGARCIWAGRLGISLFRRSIEIPMRCAKGLGGVCLSKSKLNSSG